MNLHGCPLEPKSSVSANSTIPAYEKNPLHSQQVLFGAGNEARTRYLHLGKVALYRMSYARISKRYITTKIRNVKRYFPQSAIFFLLWENAKNACAAGRLVVF